MAVTAPASAEQPPRLEDLTELEREDLLDCCAAAEALDEFLQDREITPLEDFIRELGLDKDLEFREFRGHHTYLGLRYRN